MASIVYVFISRRLRVANTPWGFFGIDGERVRRAGAGAARALKLVSTIGAPSKMLLYFTRQRLEHLTGGQRHVAATRDGAINVGSATGDTHTPPTRLHSIHFPWTPLPLRAVLPSAGVSLVNFASPPLPPTHCFLSRSRLQPCPALLISSGPVSLIARREPERPVPSRAFSPAVRPAATRLRRTARLGSLACAATQHLRLILLLLEHPHPHPTARGDSVCELAHSSCLCPYRTPATRCMLPRPYCESNLQTRATCHVQPSCVCRLLLHAVSSAENR